MSLDVLLKDIEFSTKTLLNDAEELRTLSEGFACIGNTTMADKLKSLSESIERAANYTENSFCDYCYALDQKDRLNKEVIVK